MSEEGKPLDMDAVVEAESASPDVDVSDTAPEAVVPTPADDVAATDESELPPHDVGPETDQEALQRLAAEVESLHLQLEDRIGQYKRIAADFDNFRKRTEREKSDLEHRAKRDTLAELLPVIDSFDMARTQINPQTEAEVSIHKSYQGVYKQLVDCLKRIGVSPMRAEGQPFDPNLHDAIMREPTNEHPEGTVLQELRRGYLLGETVLRHAMVKVAMPAEPEAAESSDGSETETPEAEPVSE